MPSEAQPHTAHTPEQLFTDPALEQRWRARLTAVRLSLPDPARDNPDHAIYISNASGTFETVSFDSASAAHTQATDRANGTTTATLSADGTSIWWLADEGGSEFGHWRYQPFGSGPCDGEMALDGVAPGYPAGVEVGRSLAIVGFSDDDGTRIHIARDGAIATVYQHESDGGVAALSRDETLWVLAHSEDGDSRYPALRAYHVDSGEVAGEINDGPEKGLDALEFSPRAGDQRLLVGHERRGRDELAIWDISTGEVTELAIDLPGDVTGSFYPDGSALLILHSHQGRTTIYRYHFDGGALVQLPVATGSIGAALTRPDGSIWYSFSSAAHPSQLRQLSADGIDTVLIEPPDGGAPGSQPVHDIWVDGPGGPIHALLARPAAAPPVVEGAVNTPLPTVFLIHGGPASSDEDSFDVRRATYLDAGIAVCQVNYRGSTGYGSIWRDALTERIGHVELADIAAVQDALVLRGLVDVDQCAIAGHSWGGFLTLLALGTQPSRWQAGVAGVPVADYTAAYEDEMEPLRAYDRALFGGSPQEVPGKYIDSSPLTWVDQVRTPVLLMVGANDPRCPVRQIDNYIAALQARGADYEVYRFDAGHGSLVVAERLRQVACEVDFIRRHLAEGAADAS